MSSLPLGPLPLNDNDGADENVVGDGVATAVSDIWDKEHGVHKFETDLHERLINVV